MGVQRHGRQYLHRVEGPVGPQGPGGLELIKGRQREPRGRGHDRLGTSEHLRKQSLDLHAYSQDQLRTVLHLQEENDQIHGIQPGTHAQATSGEQKTALLTFIKCITKIAPAYDSLQNMVSFSYFTALLNLNRP